MKKVLLIVPCFNEEDRLQLKEFTSAEENISFLFANDGSTDCTSKIVNSIVDNKRIYLFDSKQNFGKANIIYEAYKYAEKLNILNDYDWIGYWDADLATPLYEVNNMLRFAENYSEPKGIFGSRVNRLGSKITRSPKRHYLGRIFATIVSVILDVKSYDSQCGAKLFEMKTAKIAFNSPFITNWIFDIEILLRLNQKRIIEYPLLEWVDVPGSKVNIIKDINKVIRDIYRLWKKYKK